MNTYEKYAKGASAREEVLLWVGSVLKNKMKKSELNQTEVEHTIDYLVSDSSPKRLIKMSYEEAKLSADKWTKTQQKKGRDITEGPSDTEVFHEFSDGSKILKLISENAFKREGHLMSHCLGGYSPSIDQDVYSYRDAKNIPHATFEVRKNENEITQIKGKGNGPIHPKYIDPILIFMELLDQTVRPSDMKNLGYLHIHKDLADFAKTICPKDEQLITIKKELYVYKAL